MTAAEDDLPVLIVGDVHGDVERLFSALRPYPPERWRTVFLGDLVDGGPFGVGALRSARDRPHSQVLLGNHEALMLAALTERRRDPRNREALVRWLGVGGQQHDLDELARDPGLEAWLRERPALLRLPDGTLAQHADTDAYARLAELAGLTLDGGEPVERVNRAVRTLLSDGREDEVWDALSVRDTFRRYPARLQTWLERMRAPRLVHGHSPHAARQPLAYAEGRAINFDGGLGRWGGSPYRRRTPAAATVAPLPPLVN